MFLYIRTREVKIAFEITAEHVHVIVMMQWMI